MTDCDALHFARQSVDIQSVAGIVRDERRAKLNKIELPRVYLSPGGGQPPRSPFICSSLFGLGGGRRGPTRVVAVFFSNAISISKRVIREAGGYARRKSGRDYLLHLGKDGVSV